MFGADVCTHSGFDHRVSAGWRLQEKTGQALGLMQSLTSWEEPWHKESCKQLGMTKGAGNGFASTEADAQWTDETFKQCRVRAEGRKGETLFCFLMKPGGRSPSGGF